MSKNAPQIPNCAASPSGVRASGSAQATVIHGRSRSSSNVFCSRVTWTGSTVRRGAGVRFAMALNHFSIESTATSGMIPPAMITVARSGA